MTLFEARRKQQNSRKVYLSQQTLRRLFYVAHVAATIYLRRAGELHFIQVHLSAANYLDPDVGKLTPLLEGE